MSQEVLDVETSLNRPELRAGELNAIEKQWAERQVALEKIGYMLRSRYHLGWRPSWINTNKLFWNLEDGQAQAVIISYHFDFFEKMLTYFRNAWSWTQPGFLTANL